MAGPPILIFHRPAGTDDAPLVRLLATARRLVGEQQAALFRQAGGGQVRWLTRAGASFGELLAAEAPRRGGLVVLGSGAAARLNGRDAGLLVAAARAGGRRALTNNRYSSDICAVSDAAVLAGLPALPSDNSLPRWLEERAGFTVAELAGRQRLALDLDTPLDVALAALAPAAPGWLRRLVADADLAVPRRAELRALAAEPHLELLVFGRTGSRTLAWLERNVRCRVRFLAEERGLRASSPLAIAEAPTRGRRPPRATLGRLLSARGPGALADIVAEFADGAIVDSRVLMADHFGADEAGWPAPADRYASDLLRADEIGDSWLRALSAAAAGSAAPILLGSHTMIGPGIPLVLTGAAADVE